LTTGDAAIISGVGVAGYNVTPPITPTFVVTVTSPTQFTYTDPTSGLAASGGGILVGPTTANAFVSGNPVPLVILGAGFTPASQIRVNETPIPTTFNPSRPGELIGTIPANLLTQPVRFVVDVLNPGNLYSNVFNLMVGQPVAVGNSPLGIAIGSVVLQTTPPTELELALVANSTDGTVSVVDISPVSPTFGTVTSLITVGSTPVDVGIVSRTGLAAVSNSGASTASIVNLTTNPITVLSTVSVGSDPTGVAVNQSLGSAVVTNTASNSVSLIPLATASVGAPGSLAVDAQPDAAAIAPDLNISVVANGAGNDATLMDVSTGSPAFLNRVSNITAPTGVDYDPVTQDFLIVSSASNTVTQLNVTPTGSNTYSLLQSSVRVGINPTSLAYDFQSGALLTLNTASNTLSVVDLATCTTTTLPVTACNTASIVRDILPYSGTVEYALAIHPWLGYFVLSDSANNRLVILPMPR
jgi:DNA-binding beta-propeller fold protein YncE